MHAALLGSPLLPFPGKYGDPPTLQSHWQLAELAQCSFPEGTGHHIIEKLVITTIVQTRTEFVTPPQEEG